MAEQVMLPLHVEILLGHDTGLSMSYYRPAEKTLLEDYLKAVDLLSINSQQSILKKKVAELKEKSEQDQYIIKGKLAERDQQIEALTKKQEKFEQLIQSLVDTSSQLSIHSLFVCHKFC